MQCYWPGTPALWMEEQASVTTSTCAALLQQLCHCNAGDFALLQTLHAGTTAHVAHPCCNFTLARLLQ
jgi:hypothetical protein